MEAQRIDATRLLNTAQVSDSHLLALACAHEGQLASFDRRLVTDAVRGGARRLHLISQLGGDPGMRRRCELRAQRLALNFSALPTRHPMRITCPAASA